MSKENLMRHKNWWKILILGLALIFLSAFFAFAFYILNIEPESSRNLSPNKIILPAEVIGTEKNYWLGSANPKITIVEFGDYACSYCHKSFPKIRAISEQYKSDIKYIWRDYPLISEFSADLALSTRCAGEQGLFWPMHDKLFINFGIKSEVEIKEIFRQLGGDEKRFASCLINDKHIPDIEKDISDGQTLQITGTPTWFINGKRIEGDIPYEFLINLINSEIKK
jgi:protein-disulfide isomerase